MARRGTEPAWKPPRLRPPLSYNACAGLGAIKATASGAAHVISCSAVHPIASILSSRAALLPRLPVERGSSHDVKERLNRADPPTPSPPLASTAEPAERVSRRRTPSASRSSVPRRRTPECRARLHAERLHAEPAERVHSAPHGPASPTPACGARTTHPPRPRGSATPPRGLGARSPRSENAREEDSEKQRNGREEPEQPQG